MKRSIAAALLLFCMAAIAIAAGRNEGHGNIHVVMLGDSNTWIGGDDCDDEKGWNKWFKDCFNPASCRSYARSGATWTNTSRTKTNTEENIAVLGDDNVIYNQVMRLRQAVENGSQTDPDLIIIAAGTNDAWFQNKRPFVFGDTPEYVFRPDSKPFTANEANQMKSLAQAVRYNCELLSESFPNAQIVLLTPLQCTATTLENIRKAGDIIEECGNYMGISVIRQDRQCCISRTQELREKRFTSDGTHTNAEGARRNGTFLANQIATLLQIR